MDSTNPEVFEIPSHRMDDLIQRVARLAEKSRKAGLSPITINVLGEKAFRYLGGSRVHVVKLVTVEGEAPVINGFTFVARTEHTPMGNIMSKAPGARHIEVPAELRDGDSYCDHCKKSRRRIDTFLLQDAEGAFIRVGRNCLADFIRCTDPSAALQIWTLLKEIKLLSSWGEDKESFGGGPVNYDLHCVIAAAFRSVELFGWVSRSDALEQNKRSTSEATIWALELPSPKDETAWKEAQPTAANAEEARAALAWVQDLKGANDYEHNLKVACALSYTTPRNMGLVVSVVQAYHRAMERELETRRQAQKTQGSKHFGEVGCRYVRKLTVIKIFEITGDYGLTVIYNLVDEEGNSFKWFSSGGCSTEHAEGSALRPLRLDDTRYFTFGVKRHGDYKGAAETIIERASASLTAPAIKWCNQTTGEVFKTKKDLLAKGAVA